MIYLGLKATHILLALCSAGLFVWRLLLNWQGFRLTGIRRWGPHIIDTLLFTSAIVLAYLFMPWPLPVWLQTKLWMLLAYILCAGVTMRLSNGWSKGLLSVVTLSLLVAIFYLARYKPWW